MLNPTRYALAPLAIGLLIDSATVAQQQVAPQQALPPQAAQQQPAQGQVPTGFQLNAIQQTFVDQVLDAWQRESGKIVSFKCSFQRWEYSVAFGPGPNIPQNKNLGDLSYHRPDKGSFQITEVNTFQQKPVSDGQQPAPQAGDWVKRPEAIGEHWVCDGKSVFEYRHNQKQLVERPIPPQLQGKSIADGPLPFLFGAEAAKLKQRYWLRVEAQGNPAQIWLVAKPRFQEQAADFSQVQVILNRERLLPEAMEVLMPNGDRHVYMFDIANAKVNGTLDRIQALFERPRTPSGWKRVVENVPVAQAPQPVQPAR